MVANFEEEKGEKRSKITRRRVYDMVLLLSGFSISFIMISASMLVSNVQAIVDIDNKSNIMPHESSFANGTQINHSSMDTTMMQMMERGDIAMVFDQNKITHQFLATLLVVKLS